MATHNVTVTWFLDLEFDTVEVIGGDQTLNVVAGDVVNFVLKSSDLISVSGTGLQWFTVTTAPAMAKNLTFSRTIKSGVSGKAYITLNSEGTPVYITLDAAAPTPDTTPDPFSFLSLSDVDLGVLYVSNAITVSGINAPAPISISGAGAEYRIGTGAWRTTSDTVVAGNTVELRLRSSAANSSTTSTTLTIGGVARTWTLTTVKAYDATNSVLVPIGVGSTGTVSMVQHIYGLFGGKAPLSSYRRGGSYVPDIPQTAGIPNSGAVNLLSFRNSSAILSFKVPPRNVVLDADTSTGGKALEYDYFVNQDFTLGHHPEIADNVEVQFSYAVISSLYRMPEIVDSSSTWVPILNQAFIVRAEAPAYSERMFGVEVTMGIRHKMNPGAVMTSKFRIILSFYGR